MEIKRDQRGFALHSEENLWGGPAEKQLQVHLDLMCLRRWREAAMREKHLLHLRNLPGHFDDAWISLQMKKDHPGDQR